MLFRSLNLSPFSTRVCVIGSGPSGFYTAKYLAEKNSNLFIDMYERLPVPYGSAY